MPHAVVKNEPVNLLMRFFYRDQPVKKRRKILTDDDDDQEERAPSKLRRVGQSSAVDAGRVRVTTPTASEAMDQDSGSDDDSDLVRHVGQG